MLDCVWAINRLHANDCLYRSFDGDPSLVGKVIFLIDAGHFPSGLFNPAFPIQLNFDVLLHNLRASIEKDNKLSLVKEFVIRQESICDAGLVTNNASKSGANLLSGNNLNYMRVTLALMLSLSSPGVMSAILFHWRGALLSLFSSRFSSYCLGGRFSL